MKNAVADLNNWVQNYKSVKGRVSGNDPAVDPEEFKTKLATAMRSTKSKEIFAKENDPNYKETTQTNNVKKQNVSIKK